MTDFRTVRRFVLLYNEEKSGLNAFRSASLQWHSMTNTIGYNG
jgi:hypothetical protein